MISGSKWIGTVNLLLNHMFWGLYVIITIKSNSLGIDVSFFMWGVKNKETKIVEGNKNLNTFPPQVSHSNIKCISSTGFSFSYKYKWIPILLTVVTSHTKALPSAGHRDRMLAMVLKNEVSNHETFFFIYLNILLIKPFFKGLSFWALVARTSMCWSSETDLSKKFSFLLQTGLITLALCKFYILLLPR